MKTHTPLPWFVRNRIQDGAVVDCFVAARDVNGFAYDAEILGDDEYRESVDRKLADAEFIVKACNAHDALLMAVSRAEDLFAFHVPITWGGR